MAYISAIVFLLFLISNAVRMISFETRSIPEKVLRGETPSSVFPTTDLVGVLVD